MPCGAGMLQSCGMPLAPGGTCDWIRGTAAKLGCCWWCWGGRNIWERLAVGWGKSRGCSVALPLWLVCPACGASLRRWALRLGCLAGHWLVAPATEARGRAVTGRCERGPIGLSLRAVEESVRCLDRALPPTVAGGTHTPRGR